MRFKELSNGTSFSEQGEDPMYYFGKYVETMLDKLLNNAKITMETLTLTHTHTQYTLTDPQLEIIETTFVDLLQLVPQSKRELNQRL